MKKSSLFISAVLTTFVLAILVGVFTLYRNFTGSVQDPVTQLAPVVSNVVSATITAQDAAQIAAQFLGRGDLFAVENASLNGMNAYLITFSSGDVVYIGLQGQVLSSIAAPTANVVSTSPSIFLSGSNDDHNGGDDD
jgi:hypothetical protein